MRRLRRFWNRARWTPWTLSAWLTCWGIGAALIGHPLVGGILLLICGVGGGAFVWGDYSLRVGRFRSDISALFSGHPPNLREFIGLATHIPQGVVGALMLWGLVGH